MGCFILCAGKQQTKMKHYSRFFWDWLGKYSWSDTGRQHTRHIPRATDEKNIEHSMQWYIRIDYIQLFVVFNPIWYSHQQWQWTYSTHLLHMRKKLCKKVNLMWNADISFTIHFSIRFVLSFDSVKIVSIDQKRGQYILCQLMSNWYTAWKK